MGEMRFGMTSRLKRISLAPTDLASSMCSQNESLFGTNISSHCGSRKLLQKSCVVRGADSEPHFLRAGEGGIQTTRVHSKTR